MELRDWRIAQGLSQQALGVALGITSGNPASFVERVENGKVKADADLAAALSLLTEGAVTPADLHRTRLLWLRASGRARRFGSASSGDTSPSGNVPGPAAEITAQDEKVCP